jgi:hypothetical protein
MGPIPFAPAVTALRDGPTTRRDLRQGRAPAPDIEAPAERQAPAKTVAELQSQLDAFARYCNAGDRARRWLDRRLRDLGARGHGKPAETPTS